MYIAWSAPTLPLSGQNVVSFPKLIFTEKSLKHVFHTQKFRLITSFKSLFRQKKLLVLWGLRVGFLNSLYKTIAYLYLFHTLQMHKNTALSPQSGISKSWNLKENI